MSIRSCGWIVFLFCFLVMGCVPYYQTHRRFPDPYVARGVVTGSALGAAGGAAIDHNDRGRGAAIGAAGGGVLGGVLESRGGFSQSKVRPWLYGKKVSVVFERDWGSGYGNEVRAMVEEELILMGASVYDDPRFSSRRDSTGRSSVDYAVEVHSSERSGYTTSVDIRVIDVATSRVVAIGSSTIRYGYDFGFGSMSGYRNHYYDDRVENVREAARDAIQSLP